MDSTRPIRALMRGLDALAVLNSRDGASVSEVAAEIRLPRTTAHRILETLRAAGFVSRDAADERYRLTPVVRGLSDGFEDESWVGQLAKPAIDELCATIVWPVQLATASGTQMLLRETTDDQTPLAIEHTHAGGLLPMLESAAGRCHLAHCPPAQRDSLIELLAHSGRAEDKLARARPVLLRLLEEIRQQGFAAMTRSGRLLDEISLSVPIRLDERNRPVLTVRFMAQVLPLQTGLERFLPPLRRCAAKISQAFLEQQAAARSKSAQATAV